MITPMQQTPSMLSRSFVNGLVKSQYVPDNPVNALNLDLTRPIVYALKTKSMTDLVALQRACKELGLPDPLTPIKVNGVIIPSYVCLDNPAPLFGQVKDTDVFFNEFQQLLRLHKDDKALDIQLMPVALFWGRAPGKEGQVPLLSLANSISPSRLRKTFIVGLNRKDNLVRFNKPVSLRFMADQHGTDEKIVQKLIRVAKIHFSRQKLAASGPKLPNRYQLFEQLLRNPEVKKAIQVEIAEQNISAQKAEKRANDYIDEIASDFSYKLVKNTSNFMTWLWNKIYSGIKVNNAEQVRKLAADGHEIVFMPCHRSHMDYLLISYVIYNEGLIPPHIAAGINLNFFPAGPMFRRGGAFFLRRTFKGNKLYATIFREYLSLLFSKGYSVEFFTEGGRSRTGRLLPPKTGMLNMTLQAMLREQSRPITLVPVYLGYDHVMEVSTYVKELSGANKKKESMFQVFGIAKKLKNYGQAFVNFGEPINLNQYLNKHVENWRDDMNMPVEEQPQWLHQTTRDLANQVMVKINNAAAVNALTICALILHAAPHKALSREILVKQIDSYLKLLRNNPYSEFSTLPENSAEEILDQAISLKKFTVREDSLGQMLSMSYEQAVLLTFYRNNILHLFAVPSLIAAIASERPQINVQEINAKVRQLYPLIQAELFLKYSDDELDDCVTDTLSEMQQQGLIENNNDVITPVAERLMSLKLLAASIQETLQRYSIVLTVLEHDQVIEKKKLEDRSQLIAERLSSLNGVSAPEFFDKKVFAIFIEKLQELDYLSDTGTAKADKIAKLSNTVRSLTTLEVKQTISDVMLSQQTNDA
ncbi:glycerol-3-phosphate 1-O-acyltransferase PlsB [Moritella sp. 24]|nr:glycerol-3-phosphate 1-O-acyltransferase PlsB [Moritella sp. 24]